MTPLLPHVARAAVAAVLIFAASPVAPASAAGLDFSFVTRLIDWWAGREPPAPTSPLERVQRRDSRFALAEADWQAFEIQPVRAETFREEIGTEGRMAIDENSATPVTSPFAGRVTRVLVQPGDEVERGQPLFMIEGADMVQAQNDFAAATAQVDKAASALHLAEINARRQRDLLAGRAAPQRDVDQALADLESARADMRAANTALQAVENRLRLFGKTDEDIAQFRATRIITPDIVIRSPIHGTIVQRKVALGQFIPAGAGEPQFVIDDLDTLWLLAFVREDDSPRVRRGAPIGFRVLAFRDTTFRSRLDFVAGAIDPATRRLLVRATVDNRSQLFKQQMFANVTIQVGDPTTSPAVPRAAIIYEGPVARVWVAHPDRSVELRRVRVGIVAGERAQILQGLSAGEQVVVRGTLFIDQMTAALRR